MLRFILQSYLKFALSTLFALYVIKFSSEMTSVNASISIVIFLVLFAMPIFFGIIMSKNRANL